MPIPQLKRRSYGFIDRQTERIIHEQGETIKVEIRREQRRQHSNKWLKIAIYPFLLVWYILKILWWILGKRPKLSKKTKQALRARLGWLILTGAVFVFLFGAILIAWASRDLPDPDKLTDRKVAQSTKIYDRAGEHLLYEVFADQKRTLVSLDKIPRDLINGVIATEDTEFYQHKGIRPLSFVRAVIYGIFTSKRVGGTSTLTQQLVKNAILTTERSYMRKLKEIILSLRLEQKYSKDQILQIYFNEIPYGSTNYGAESAAQSYFGKHVPELNLQESATLAGLPQAPTYYLNNPDVLKQRRDFVLKRMFDAGYITQEQKEKAQAEPLTLQKRYSDMRAPHFVLYVKEQLVDQYGEQTVDTGGLKVISSLDWDKQLAAENAVSSSAKLLSEGQANNAALVALDPKTGQILAMVGSRDFNNKEIDGQFNVAVQGKRQPGSSFKPIVYAAAFEKGYTADTLLWDVSTNFAVSGPVYQPQDYDGGERGPVIARQALQGSLNIPAVEALYLVGSKKGVEFAEKMGYTTLSEGEFGLSLVLGGGEVKLLEHTAAFGIFADNGIKQEIVSILKVEDADGAVLFEWKKKKGEQVLEQKITDIVSNILSDDAARAFIFGAGGVLTLKDRPVAAKTGTTNNYRDAWTVGYTPSLVAGVWVGNTNNKEMRKGDGGSKLAAPIWNKFMAESLKNTPAESFLPMPENDAAKAILRGVVGGGTILKINKLTGRIAASSTPLELIEERTYAPAHSILHYVYKDDPRGPVPEHPEDDPQYQIWENAIQDWLKRKKEKDPNFHINFDEPPTELDDPDLIGLLPDLEVIYPSEGAILRSRQIETNIRASSPRGISRVLYKIDNNNVGVVRNYPFNLDYYNYDLADGEHTLFITAEDAGGIKAEKQIKFTLQAGEEQPAIYFADKNLSLTANDFPRTILLNHFKLDQIKTLRVYKEKDGTRSLVTEKNSFSDLFNNQIIIKWSDYPGVGSWNLISEIELKSGGMRESGRVSVAVQ